MLSTVAELFICLKADGEHRSKYGKHFAELAEGKGEELMASLM